jgi:hypothetical protein
MKTLTDQVKAFHELPSLKAKLEELNFRLESLEKIKDSVTSENYANLTSSQSKQSKELSERINELQSGILELKNELEMNSKISNSENLILEKELQQLQFMFESNALSKEDFQSKRNSIQKKINKNKSQLDNNQSFKHELDFYATYVGNDSYLKNTYSKQADSLKSKFFSIKPGILITIGVIVLLLLSAIIFHKPLKERIVENMDWYNAKKENTWESYELYMAKYPDGRRFKKAKEKQEAALWGYARTNRNIEFLDTYLKMYPSGEYLREAKLVKDTLYWDRATKAGSFSAYNSYVKEFPEGQFVQEAMKKSIENMSPDTLYNLLLPK